MRSPNTTPKHVPMRIYLGFFWMFAILITTAYSGNLIAFLTISQKTPPIKTLSQLGQSPLTLEGVSFWKTQFRPSIDETVRSFATRLQSISNLEEAFDKVESGDYALVENRGFLELYIAGKYTYGNEPSIRIVDQCLIPFNIGIGLQKYSPLTPSFNSVVMRLVESGLTKRWNRDVSDEFRLRNSKKNNKNKIEKGNLIDPLTIDHMLGVYMVFFGGLGIAGLIFVGEVVMMKLRTNNNETNNK